MRCAAAIAMSSLLLVASWAAWDNSSAALGALLSENRGNRTALHHLRAPAWVASPEIRGTLGIVWSCLVTLVACIYTALHLNVPNRTGIWDMALYKAKWAAVGLFVPEVLLYIAVSQFFEARQLQTRMKALVRERRSSQPGDPDEVCRASSRPAA